MSTKTVEQIRKFRYHVAVYLDGRIGVRDSENQDEFVRKDFGAHNLPDVYSRRWDAVSLMYRLLRAHRPRVLTTADHKRERRKLRLERELKHADSEERIKVLYKIDAADMARRTWETTHGEVWNF